MRYLLDANACVAMLHLSDPGPEACVRPKRFADVGLFAPFAPVAWCSLTANVPEFARVDGLACEDWSGPLPGG